MPRSMPTVKSEPQKPMAIGNRTVDFKNHLEGGLDLRYMADRYNRGKEFVQKFMAKRQRYVAAGMELCDVHADTLTWQSDVCGSGAGFTRSIQFLKDVRGSTKFIAFSF